MQVQKQMQERFGKDLFFYSITLDPEVDTPEVLAEYVKNSEIGPGWKFLTGRPQDIMLLRQKLGFYDPEAPDDDKSQHLGFLLMGNEPYGWWGTVPATAAPNQIQKLIEWLVPGATGLR